MLLVHLLQILTALDKDLIHELDVRSVKYLSKMAQQANLTFHRYRKVPLFGSATIRRFSSNVSKMSNMAVRNFEDLLQVCTRNDFHISLRISFVVVFHPSLRWSSTHPSQSNSYESPFHHVTLAWACKVPHAF